MAFTLEMTATHYGPRDRVTTDYRAVRVPTVPAAIAAMDEHWRRIGRSTGTRLDVQCTSDAGDRLFFRTMHYNR